jgi:HEAT repeat protein
MSKGNVVALAIVLALVGGIAIVAYSVWNHFWNYFDPVYHGQRVYTWADQAIRDEDPAARRRAADVLVEAIREMPEGPSTQLVMRFCNKPLPKEVLPVLLEALRVKEMPPGSYPAMALSLVEPAEAVPALVVPALVGVLENEADPETRERAIAALGRLGSRAKAAVPALRAALDDANQEVRQQAVSALKQIAPGESGKPGGWSARE